MCMSPKHVLARALEGRSVYQALQSAMNATFCLETHDGKTRCLKRVSFYSELPTIPPAFTTKSFMWFIVSLIESHLGPRSHTHRTGQFENPQALLLFL